MRTIIVALLAGGVIGLLAKTPTASANHCGHISDIYSSKATCCNCSYQDVSVNVYKNNGDIQVTLCMCVVNLQNVSNVEVLEGNCEIVPAGADTGNVTVTSNRPSPCQAATYRTRTSIGGCATPCTNTNEDFIFGTLCDC